MHREELSVRVVVYAVGRLHQPYHVRLLHPLTLHLLLLLGGHLLHLLRARGRCSLAIGSGRGGRGVREVHLVVGVQG